MDTLLSDVCAAILHNVPNLDSGRSFQIIIMREAQKPGTPPGGPTRARWSLLLDDKLRFPQASFVTRSSFLLTNAVPTNIRVKLHLPRDAESVVLSNSELDRMTRSEFIQRFPDNPNWERVSISQPGFNLSKTEAILYANHDCAGCGGGSYILLRKANGVWHIVDEHETWTF